MKTIFAFLFSYTLCISLQAQIWDWGRLIPSQSLSSASNSGGTRVAVDPLGNIVITGKIADSVNIGGSQLLPDQGFLTKYGPDGTILWAKNLVQNPCGWSTIGTSVKVNAIGEIFVAINCDTALSQKDFTIKKFDPQGIELAAWKTYGEGSGEVKDIELGSNGEIFVVGSLFQYTSGDTLYLGGKGVRCRSQRKPFLFKLDGSGNAIWGKTDETPFPQKDAWGNSIAVDKQGNSYLMGLSRNDLDFGNGVIVTVGSITTGELFVVKYDPNGVPLWGRASTPVIGGAQTRQARSIEVDNHGKVYLFGHHSSTFRWDTLFAQTSFESSFLLCISDQGDPLWLESIQIHGSYAFEKGDMAIDTTSGDILVVGSGGSASIDNFSVNQSCGGITTHVVAFDSAGQAKWMYGVPCNDLAGKDVLSSGIALDQKGGIYISGDNEYGIFGLDTLSYTPINPWSYVTTPFVAKLLEEEISLVGRVFRDFNGNGIQDSLDIGLPGFPLESAPLNLNTISNTSGAFQFSVNLDTHTVELPFIPQHHTLPSPPSSTYTTIPDSIGQVIGGHNFGLVPTPNIHDLEISLSPVTPVRPGFLASYQIQCKNVGSTTQNSSIEWVHPDTLSFISSSLPYTSYNDTTSTLLWNLGNLAPYTEISFTVSFQVPVTLLLGGNINSVIHILPITGDIEPQDNQDSLVQTVTGSFDPNDKQVLSSPVLSPDMVSNQQEIDYLIRFQNTGTDTAFTVIVEDTMSNKLDWSTFQMIDASHSYRLSISEDGLFSWRFDDILLPDSNVNEQKSHGFIRFQIAPNPDLLIGDTIQNQAAIFFDYNEPVWTNISQTPVAIPTSLPLELADGLNMKVYPNPGDGRQQLELEVPIAGKWNLYVVNIHGQTIKEESLFLAEGSHSINRNWQSLPSAWYLVMLRNGKRQISQKWIKQ